MAPIPYRPRKKNDPIESALDTVSAPEWVRRLYRAAAPYAQAATAGAAAYTGAQAANWARYQPTQMAIRAIAPTAQQTAANAFSQPANPLDYGLGSYSQQTQAPVTANPFGGMVQPGGPLAYGQQRQAGAQAGTAPLSYGMGSYAQQPMSGQSAGYSGAPDWLAGTGLWKDFQSGPVKYSRAAGLDDVTGFSRWYFNSVLPRFEASIYASPGAARGRAQRNLEDAKWSKYHPSRYVEWSRPPAVTSDAMPGDARTMQYGRQGASWRILE